MVFNVGDRIQNKSSGGKGVVCDIAYDKNYLDVFVKYDNGGAGHSGGSHPASDYYKLITDTKSNKVVGTFMNLKEKFLQSLLSEPEKTFRKVGITNGDNLLTCEGKELFENWLFQANKDKFKTEVADGLLAEQEKENK